MRKSIILLLSMFLATQVSPLCAEESVDGQSGATTVQEKQNNGKRGKKNVSENNDSKKSDSNSRNKKSSKKRGSKTTKQSSSKQSR